jgi:hypothetical protein
MGSPTKDEECTSCTTRPPDEYSVATIFCSGKSMTRPRNSATMGRIYCPQTVISHGTLLQLKGTYRLQGSHNACLQCLVFSLPINVQCTPCINTGFAMKRGWKSAHRGGKKRKPEVRQPLLETKFFGDPSPFCIRERRLLLFQEDARVMEQLSLPPKRGSNLRPRCQHECSRCCHL